MVEQEGVSWNYFRISGAEVELHDAVRVGFAMCFESLVTDLLVVARVAATIDGHVIRGSLVPEPSRHRPSVVAADPVRTNVVPTGSHVLLAAALVPLPGSLRRERRCK